MGSLRQSCKAGFSRGAAEGMTEKARGLARQRPRRSRREKT
jgi:hypothetical protein